jgi:hypothetical protein
MIMNAAEMDAQLDAFDKEHAGTYKGYNYWLRRNLVIYGLEQEQDLHPAIDAMLRAMGQYNGYIETHVTKGDADKTDYYYDYPYSEIDCHGGLTYGCFENGHLIIGFDTVHAYDTDRLSADYCIEQCKSIIDQLITFAKKEDA